MDFNEFDNDEELLEQEPEETLQDDEEFESYEDYSTRRDGVQRNRFRDAYDSYQNYRNQSENSNINKVNRESNYQRHNKYKNKEVDDKQKDLSKDLNKDKSAGNNPNPQTPSKSGDGLSKAGSALNAANAAKNIATSDNKSEAAKDAAKTVAKEKVKQGLLEFLMAHPVVIAVIAGILSLLFLIIFVLFAVSSMESTGSGNYTCDATSDSPISVTRTPLSKSEFIQKVRAYTPTRQEYVIPYETFKENAGLIYDTGVEYGINPELAVIRAIIEGFDPGRDYNYWGIGCYNGGGACRGHYASMRDGLIAFYNTLKSYNTDNMVDIMYRYAYIGDRWLYPGSSSDGGCYYVNYPGKSGNFPEKLVDYYLSEPRKSEVINSCANGTQIPTTAEDQRAYATYQVYTNTMPLRKAIFGLDADSVSVCDSFVATVDANPTNTNVTPIIANGDGSVESILNFHGSSVRRFNDTLKANTIKNGIGTRRAVAEAATLFINTFEAMGYRVPYSYGGGWGEGWYANNFHVNSYYGINPNMGNSINGGRGYTQQFDSGPTTYYNLGLDCSGFVTWALVNGGINYNLVTADSFKYTGNVRTYNASSTSEYVGQAGDVLSSPAHVVLILKYEPDENAYLVAEAAGKDEGILIKRRYLSSLSNYKVVDMSYFYENYVNENYEEDFDNGRKG